MPARVVQQEPPASLPRWVAVADTAAAVALFLAGAVVVGGGFRVSAGSMRLSVTSAATPAAIGVLLLVARHVRFPRPHVLDRARTVLGRLTGSDAWRAAWGPFVATRTALVVLGLLAVFTLGYPPGEPRVRVSENELVNLAQRWDAGWYTAVARRGYFWDRRAADRQINIAFFPAYPMLIRGVARVFGGREPAFLLAGVAISHVAFLWALILLYRLARLETGDEGAARGSVLLLACYPFSVFHAAVYTESLFLLSVLGAILGLRQQRWAPALLWGMLAGLTRPNGFLLVATLGALMLSHRLWQRRDGRAGLAIAPLAAVAAPALGAAIYSAYIAALTGNPLQWWAQHAAWGRTFEGMPFAESAGMIAGQGFFAYLAALPYDFLNGVPALAAVALIVPVWRRLGPAYAVFLAVNVVPPLLMGGTMSMGRVTATMFPMFVWMAMAAGPSAMSLAAAFALLQGFVGALFYTWRALF
jgi:Mannosyltransferase (PIG-V)